MPWREPTRSLPLVWGRYPDRYLAGLTLGIAGAAHMQGTNTYSLPFLFIGTAVIAVGWAVLPARGWRRAVAVLLAVTNAAALLVGPVAMWTFVFALLAWLVVRHRPPRSYVTLLFPVANGLILPRFFEDYGWMPVTLSISLAVLVASAWLARVIAVGPRSPVPARRGAA